MANLSWAESYLIIHQRPCDGVSDVVLLRHALLHHCQRGNMRMLARELRGIGRDRRQRCVCCMECLRSQRIVRSEALLI